ncbi:uncharacterized protein DDB_G0290301-like isoform X2 [Portunus trituberculatus]|uniref:uncharacterized protein DDB_G0290301-like isoform X2 n=1 Tax=Portunus trituberculatus TaxID=210409 RepID=UPI001E1D10A0|nr:uncharacterized protein DDB_G0290301-like isoform X2 [Portunus trituberculatus]
MALMMNRRGGFSGRRHSFLDLSCGGASLRPRSCSTSVLTVTESTPELRSPADFRRPPATQCFISPRMAFTPQFSYDSPIQIITCGSNTALKPIVQRFRLGPLLCSKKGLLLIALLTISIVSFLFLNGKEYGLQTEGQCDTQDPAAPCHGHEAANPLKRFLREQFIWKQPTADIEQDDAPVAQEEEEEEDVEEEEKEEEERKEGSSEQRTNRPRMLTVHGQYESSAEEIHNQDTSRESAFANKPEARGEHGEENKGKDHLSREDLQRASRAVMNGEGTYPDAQINNKEQHSMRVISEERLPLTPQQPVSVKPDGELKARSQRYIHEHPPQRGHEYLEQLYIQHGNQNQGYQHEQQIVQQEIEAQEWRLRQQEEMWQEHGRQAHQKARENYAPPHRRELHYPPPSGGPHHAESGGLDRQHPVWRDHQLHGQRLPRGVSPRRYHRSGDL